jgi:aerobic carbon-monoxide dehydrogenase small subunit
VLSYTLTVNGVAHLVEDAWAGESLLHVLRERLGLPAAKAGCEQGECGSCSVLVDDTLVCACLVLAAAAVDRDITTLEGLQPDEQERLNAIQQTFVDEGAIQCGFCTPGLVVAVADLLRHSPTPTALDIREAISGNLCRCTGYGRIVAAVEAAARD